MILCSVGFLAGLGICFDVQKLIGHMPAFLLGYRKARRAS
jgi:hypothetical protein